MAHHKSTFRSPRPGRGRMLAGVALLATMLVAAPLLRADAAEDPAASAAFDVAARPPAAPDLAGTPSVPRLLGEIEVEGVEYDLAVTDYTAVATALNEAQRRRRDADRRLGELTVEHRHLTARVAAASARRAAYVAQHERVEAALHEIVIDLFVDGQQPHELEALLEPEHANDPARRRVLGDAAMEVLQIEEERLGGLMTEAVDDERAARGQLEHTNRRMHETVGARDGAASEAVSLDEPVADARVALEVARAVSTVVGGDFALVALDAYQRAARDANTEDPECAVAWWAIAGISRVEGRHGTYGGAELDHLGLPSHRIIGIPLDGTHNTREIRDTDDGRLDGDTEYDRAVGPMQFIPSTWALYDADGNGDSDDDPHNLYDAALAAADYLCRASDGLDGDEGLRRAYFSYNHSLAYVDNVLAWAKLYAALDSELGVDFDTQQ